MRPEEALVSIIALAAVSLPFLLVAFMRYLRYRETVVLAEQGLLAEDLLRQRSAANGRGSLRWGIVLSALGMALSCGLWPIGLAEGGFPLGLGPWMLIGFLPLAFGVALLLIHRLNGASEEDEALLDELPGGGPYGLGIERIAPAHAEPDDLSGVEAAQPARPPEPVDD